MPLIRRLPKRGFNNTAFKTKYALVNIVDLEAMDFSGTITEAALREHGLVRGRFDGVKILGNGDVTKKLVVHADHISASARAKIEAAGGTVTIRDKAADKAEKKAAANA